MLSTLGTVALSRPSARLSYNPSHPTLQAAVVGVDPFPTVKDCRPTEPTPTNNPHNFFGPRNGNQLIYANVNPLVVAFFESPIFPTSNVAEI